MATDVDIQNISSPQTDSYRESCNERVTGSATDSGNNSPRVSWQESFNNLSRDLQMICRTGSNNSDGSNSSLNEDTELKQLAAQTTTTGVDVNRHQNSPALPVHHQPLIMCKPNQPPVYRIVPVNYYQARGDSPTSPCLRSPSSNARNSFPFPPVVGGGNHAVTRGVLPYLSPGVGGTAHTGATQLRAGWRPVNVRHEETTDRLRQSLTKICFNNSNNGSANSSPSASTSGLQVAGQLGLPANTAAGANEASGVPAPLHSDNQSTAKSRQLRLKESLKSGMRIRLDLTEVGCDSEYLLVSVNADSSAVDNAKRQVRVCNGSSCAENKLLTCASLPNQTRISSLSCYISEANTLYIRERDKDTMHIEVSPANSAMFLPVVQENEALLTVKVILHIAECFQFEDIAVRTIDDRLVIKGCCIGSSGEQLGQSQDASFTIVMSLPEGTYTRSVRAAFACKEHQLVVSAKRAPASRRMTCNF